ncbi:methyltransferase domain-containing protein [Phenylobacterium sp.]|uniref:class I SAM-dependent methyltransferase n=1 Tax=Phenylobacterium sp. TaxID=1871053 RepID=UPI0035B2FFC8
MDDAEDATELSAAAEIVGIYRRHALAWTTARGDRLAEGGWLERFTRLLPAGGRVLDLGCGSGVPIARFFAADGHRVTGIDSSPEMIALFRANLPHEGAEIADMRSLSLGREFDGLIAWDSFFHLDFASQRGMFPIFRAHAAPGAPLMFTSGPKHGVAMGVLEGEALFHASLAPAEYRRLFEEHDFDVVAHVAEDPACGGRTVWLARRR